MGPRVNGPTAEYRLAGERFGSDYTHQDAAILNIARACEQAIDLANHIVRTERLGVIMSSAESYELLARHQIISASLATSLTRMVGFRSVAVHQYEELDITIVEAIIRNDLDDLLTFCEAVLTHLMK